MADRSKAAPVVLAGDVGGTNTRLALFAAGGREPAALEVYPSADHASLDEIVAEFRAANPLPIAAATVGVAGPVRDGHVEVVNLPWPVDAGSLAATIGLPTARVTVINDLEAAAWGVVEGGTVALLSLGTGLGEAFITFGPGGPTVHASEGGHVEFGARSQLESELREWLAQADSHVSYAAVCSGMGLVRVYEFLRSRASDPEPEWLPAEGAGDAAAAISRAAIEGRDPLASQALDLVISIFGAQAGNLALTVLATGGVYLGGGIAPKILPRLEDGPFMDAFATKGRLSAVVEAIPVRVVLNELTGLLGAASHARARGL